MEIFISRDGQKLGPYPIEQVRKLLDQGILQANDLAYHKRLNNWVMLSELDAITTNHSKTFEPNKVQAPPAFPFRQKGTKQTRPRLIVLVTLILGLAGLGALGAWYISEREEIEAAKDGSIIHSRETATFQPEPIKPTLEPTPGISPDGLDKSFASVSGAACLKLGKELLAMTKEFSR